MGTAWVEPVNIRERACLDVEARQWSQRRPGDKDAAIKWETGYSPWIHAAVVDGLVTRADVVAEYPVLCARIRRLVALRQSSRVRRL